MVIVGIDVKIVVGQRQNGGGRRQPVFELHQGGSAEVQHREVLVALKVEIGKVPRAVRAQPAKKAGTSGTDDPPQHHRVESPWVAPEPGSELE